MSLPEEQFLPGIQELSHLYKLATFLLIREQCLHEAALSILWGVESSGEREDPLLRRDTEDFKRGQRPSQSLSDTEVLLATLLSAPDSCNYLCDAAEPHVGTAGVPDSGAVTKVCARTVLFSSRAVEQGLCQTTDHFL